MFDLHALADHAFDRLWRDHLEVLDRWAIPRRAAIISGLGLDNVAETGRIFLPVPWGQPRLIVPVWSPAPLLGNPHCMPILLDVLALNPLAPYRWSLAVGDAETLDAGFAGPDQETPLYWLQDGCRGHCWLALADEEAVA